MLTSESVWHGCCHTANLHDLSLCIDKWWCKCFCYSHHSKDVCFKHASDHFHIYIEGRQRLALHFTMFQYYIFGNGIRSVCIYFNYIPIPALFTSIDRVLSVFLSMSSLAARMDSAFVTSIWTHSIEDGNSSANGVTVSILLAHAKTW